MKKLLAVIMIIATVLSLTGCGGGGEETKEVVLTDVYAKFNITGEEMMTLTADDLLSFYGIEASSVKQFAGAINSTGIKADEIVLIEAVDSNAASDIKAKLDTRYQAKLNEMENYLPDEYAVIKECEVKQNGNFVYMIVCANDDELVKIMDGELA